MPQRRQRPKSATSAEEAAAKAMAAGMRRCGSDEQRAYSAFGRRGRESGGGDRGGGDRIGSGRHFLDDVALDLLGIRLDDDIYEDEETSAWNAYTTPSHMIPSHVTPSPLTPGSASLPPSGAGGDEGDDDFEQTMCRVMPWIQNGDDHLGLNVKLSSGMSGISGVAHGGRGDPTLASSPSRNKRTKRKTKKSVSFVDSNRS